MAGAGLRLGAERQPLAEAGVAPADHDRIVARPAARTAGDAVDIPHRVEDAGIVLRDQLLGAERRGRGLSECARGRPEWKRGENEEGNSRLCHGPSLSAPERPRSAPRMTGKMVKASHVLDRVLVLEMVRVTEAAAVAAS